MNEFLRRTGSGLLWSTRDLGPVCQSPSQCGASGGGSTQIL